MFFSKKRRGVIRNQYQQKKHKWTHWTQNRPQLCQHMTLEIHVLAWDRHKNVAGLNRLMGSQPSPLDNWISNGNTYISKGKVCQWLATDRWLSPVSSNNKTEILLKVAINTINQTWQGWSLGGSLSKLCPTAPPSIQDGCCYFHQSLVAIGPVVSEEKIKMWNVDGRTTDEKWWQ
jgi:hypothetical protein